MTSIDAAVDRLLEWLAIDSTSGREAQFLEALEVYFTGLGYRCARQPVSEDRWNLIARTGVAPRLLYSTHVDTVPPHLPVRREDGVIYGRGACDTKGGIVAMAEAGVRLRDEGYDGVGYLFVVGEEVDHCGAKAARELNLRPERIVLCEPTRNRVVAAQKGMIKLELVAEGKAGHSAYPDRGVSAVHRLLDAIARLRGQDWPDHELLGPTTLNVGVLEGGVAANVFAPSARAELLFRTVSPTEPLLERIEALVAHGGEGLSLRVPASNDPVVFDPPEGVETCTVSFNTDASYLSELGPVWLVGPGDIQTAHADHEHILEADLAAGIDLYAHLGRLALDR